MSEPFVDFRHVYLAYDGAAEFAVEDIDLQTRAGEFIAIVGPSGCGKSTFMKLATGLKQPNRGSVVIDGQTVTGPLKFVGMSLHVTPVMAFGQHVMHQALVDLRIGERQHHLGMHDLPRQFALAGDVTHPQ